MALLLLVSGAQCASPADLKAATVEAFDRYIGQTEQHLNTRKSFLWADESPDRNRRVRKGEVVVEPTGANPLVDVTDGLIHDWVGAVFIPGATLAQTLDHVRDYDRARTLQTSTTFRLTRRIAAASPRPSRSPKWTIPASVMRGNCRRERGTVFCGG
jgi:hypothetical protein